MNYSINSDDYSAIDTACLVISIFQNTALNDDVNALDKACNGAISQLLSNGDFDGKKDQLVTIFNPTGIAAKRIALLGLGKEDDFNANKFASHLSAAMTALNASPAKDACIVLPQSDEHDRVVSETILAAEASLYQSDECKSEKKPNDNALENLSIHCSKDNIEATEKGLASGQAIANGIGLTKKLSDLPGNICTPTYLAEAAIQLGKESDLLNVEILEEADMEELGMGSLLSVSRGSRQPAKLIVMNYQGVNDGSKPVALVGKGLTFDAGGISIKPGAAMDEMKYDMCGGATVFGTIRACIDMQLPINVVGIVPSSENLPDGDANKPGDIVTSMSGQTIEILNTDAEGRLILCDALTYSQKFEPAAVIDIATLTGACIIALGHQTSAVMANDQDLADEIINAGTECGDRAWQLPMWDEYQSQLDSNFADMANIGGRPAGSITAACFLSRYTKSLKWAHLDIAGTAWNSGKNKGATGRPVPLVMQLLQKRCKAA